MYFKKWFVVQLEFFYKASVTAVFNFRVYNLTYNNVCG